MTDNTADLSIPRERDAREIMHKLIQTNRHHRRVIERYSDSIGMHCSAHRMLMLISRAENLPSQKELAECLKISPAAVATTIKKLESDGYIERSKPTSGGDSRQNEIKITKRGRDAAIASEKYFRCVDSSALAGFSDSELDTLVYLLDKIQNNLSSVKDIDVIADTGKEQAK